MQSVHHAMVIQGQENRGVGGGFFLLWSDLLPSIRQKIPDVVNGSNDMQA